MTAMSEWMLPAYITGAAVMVALGVAGAAWLAAAGRERPEDRLPSETWSTYGGVVAFAAALWPVVVPCVAAWAAWEGMVRGFVWAIRRRADRRLNGPTL